MTSPYDPSSDPRDNTDDPSTPRPSLLDQERVASMADEGGFSGALMDIDDDGERHELLSTLRKPRFARWQTAVVGLAVASLAMIAIGWLKRNA